MKKNFFSISIKFIIIVIILINSFEFSYSKNWELFPPNAKIWFTNDSANIYSLSADSLIENNKYMVNSKILDELTLHCYDSLYSNCKEMYSSIFKNPQNIKITQDSQIIYNGIKQQLIIKSGIHLNDFYFQLIENGDFKDTLVFTCTSVIIEQINGKDDSVKVFSIQSKLFSAKKSDFKISKNYGLRSFIDFMYFYWHEQNKSIEKYSAIGYESKEESFGYQPEDLTDKIFKWKVGDIRTMDRWYYTYSPPFGNSITYLDSVVSVIKNGNLIEIQFSRIYKDKSGEINDVGIISEKYNTYDFNKYFQEFNHFAVLLGMKDNYDNRYPVLINQGIKLTNEYGIEGKKLDLFKAYYQTDESCKVQGCVDCSYRLSYIPGPGLVKMTIYDWSTTYLEIRGYRLGNEVWGKLDLPVSVEEDIKNVKVNIHPNPAKDYIEIQSLEGLNPSEVTDIQIYDMLGIRMNSISTITKNDGIRIDVSFLYPGIYFIKIGNRFERFVKI